MVANSLNIGVLNLEGAVVGASPDVVHLEEERVVVDILLAAVDTAEGSNLLPCVVGEEVTGNDVEVLRKEVIRALEVGHKTAGRQYKMLGPRRKGVLLTDQSDQA